MPIRLKINAPHVVHDTIDGETILVNLKNGNYYSFDKLAAVIWELIVKNVEPNKIIEIIGNKFPDAGKEAQADVNDFIQRLLKENLISEETGSTPSELAADEQLPEMLVNDVISMYEPPIINKYTDMKDMLLLDPIHDTDEKGWPSGKDV